MKLKWKRIREGLYETKLPDGREVSIENYGWMAEEDQESMNDPGDFFRKKDAQQYVERNLAGGRKLKWTRPREGLYYAKLADGKDVSIENFGWIISVNMSSDHDPGLFFSKGDAQHHVEQFHEQI